MDKFMVNMYNYLNGYMERNYSNISKLDREDIAQVATQGGMLNTQKTVMR